MILKINGEIVNTCGKSSNSIDDIKIKCKQCGKTFLFRVADQIKYKKLGYFTPLYCEKCSKERRTMFESFKKLNKTIICKRCNNPFTFYGTMQEKYKRLGIHTPVHCLKCAKENQAYFVVKDAETISKATAQDKVINCRQCDHPFIFYANKQVEYREKGRSEPKLCPSCNLKTKKTSLLLYCEKCKKPFSVHKDKQEEYEELGFSNPKYCFECTREINSNSGLINE